MEPSLQAAFVEYGGNRHGFLAFSEIHPDYYRIPVADREALLAQENDLEEREDGIGTDIELSDPRPGRGQRRSFRGEPRNGDTGNLTSPVDQSRDQGRSVQPGQRTETPAEVPDTEIPGVGEQPPYESPAAAQPSNQEPAPQPDTSDVPLDWFAPEEPVQENPASGNSCSR